jgi:4-amino-4-deoxy-L-arabinose transferase-like glycosyltransferase
MRWWDESLFAVNSYEMVHNGKFFSPYYNGHPDLFNSKPPMTSWLQVAFIKLIGYNELAIRLPSAISALLCIIIIFLYLARNFDLLWAWTSALVLMTTYGFIQFHTARTGDSDAILTLYALLMNLYFIKYIYDDRKKYILLFFLFFSLAFTTKMFIPLLFCPAYLVILLMEKKLKSFVVNKEFWIGLIFFLCTTFGLILLRDLDSPGYLKKYFTSSEIAYSVIHNHEHSWNFYISNLIFTNRFQAWAFFAGIAIGMAFFLKQEKEKRLLVGLIALVVFYLIVISAVKTKLIWYDMPMYPLLAILAGYTIYRIFNMARESYNLKQWQINAFVIGSFLGIYCMMVSKADGNVIPSGEKVLEANERYIYKRIKEHKNLDGIKVYYTGHYGSLLFYKYKLADRGQTISLFSQPDFISDDKILVCSDSLKGVLRSKFELATLDKYDQAELFQIKSRIQ